MKLRIVEDWRWITTRSWSFWANNIAAVFSGLEALVQLAPDTWAEYVGRGRFAALAFVVVTVSNVLRLLKQNRGP